jgi:hypothetical protein
LVNGKALPDQPRVMSDHPEAGSNLWRRWKSLLNALVKGKRSGQLSPEWQTYDVFASDVRPGYKPNLRLARIDVSAPWGPTNFQWITRQEIIELSHGTEYVVFGKKYGSLNAVAGEYRIGRSTLRNRIEKQRMTIEEAVTKELSVTSKSQVKNDIIIDGEVFTSVNQAAKYAAERYSLNFDQARDRIRRGVSLHAPSQSRLLSQNS